MYRKDSDGWLKHTDFIVLDMICLQLAYLLAYEIRGHAAGPYETMLYRNMAIFLELADLIVIFAFDTMKSVLKRGHYVEFTVTLKHVVMVGALAVLYLFLLQQGEDYSRLTLILTFVIYAVLTYGARELWKECLYKKMKDGGERELLIVTSGDIAEEVVKNMRKNNYARYTLAGVVVVDEDWTGRSVLGVPVVASGENAPMYVCQQWIDEVLIVVSEAIPYPAELMDKLTETGVTVHLNLARLFQGQRQKAVCREGGKLYRPDYEPELRLYQAAAGEAADGYRRRPGWLHPHRHYLHLCRTGDLYRVPRPYFLRPGTGGKKRQEIQDV